MSPLLDGQQAGLDGVVRNGVDQVTQGDAFLHLALEANEHGFRHIERHDTGGGGKGDQAGTGRDGDADRETGVRVTAGTNGNARGLDIATTATENGQGSQFANCEPNLINSTRQ